MPNTFEGGVLAQTVGVALEHKIEPEALLAVVEVESAGKSMEVDGKTPCLLFERHIFYRELLKAKGEGLASSAVVVGLANKTWQPATQYKDQNTSAKRLELFARAKTLDSDCAIRSCSWGVGQTMGFLAEELKFKDATMMFNYMVAGGVPAQVECMVREIENKKLSTKLNAHDWVGFAKVYNGPGYAKNNYDSKMAAAWTKWKTQGFPKVPSVTVRVPANVQPSGPVEPPKTITKTNASATGTGLVIGGGAIVAAVAKHISVEMIALGGFVAVLAIITAVVLWQRRKASQIPQLGTLAGVTE